MKPQFLLPLILLTACGTNLQTSLQHQAVTTGQSSSGPSTPAPTPPAPQPPSPPTPPPPPPSPSGLLAFSCPAGQEDAMKYFAMSEQKRPSQFMDGANAIYTEVFPNQDFATSGYFLWLKSPDAHGFDVKSFDAHYVYDRATELNWTDNTSYKRFVQDLPLSPRCVPTGQAAPAVRASQTAFTFYASCAAYKTSNLGTSINTLDAPVMMNTGGSLGSVSTRLLHYRYNCDSNYQNCGDEEQFFLGDGYGLWEWRHFAHGQLVQTSVINQLKSGTASGTLPCVGSYQ